MTFTTPPFPSVIHRLRLERGLTQREFAAVIGFSRRSLQAWECGRVRPHISNLRRVAGALKLDVRALLDEDFEP